MKKLMIMIGVLLIAGGISAHGYHGYHGGYAYGGYHGVVVERPYYSPCVAVRPPVYYGGGYGYGYRPTVVYRGGYYRGGRCR
jgi:hypothetical protein